jgi:uncharacterized protein (DUF1778 family)
VAERTAQISFKMTPELKSAIEAAAIADSRSVSSLVIKVLTDWAKTHGHLPDKPKRR